MVKHTKIEWAHHTFNPWIGCTKVSPACDHCYAEVVARRMQVEWGVGKARKRTKPANWNQPLDWNEEAQKNDTRYRVFCASLADVFDKEVPVEWLTDLFSLILHTPNLDWLLLTKRIGNWPQTLRRAWEDALNRYDDATAAWLNRWAMGDYPSNVWLGATIVNQEEADRDIPKLLAVPAKVRFLSMEPLLGPVYLNGHIYNVTLGLAEGKDWLTGHTSQHSTIFGGHPYPWIDRDMWDLPEESKEPRIHWVIAGGESGECARPSNPNWYRSLRDQCLETRTPFLFKQWGCWAPPSSDQDLDEHHVAYIDKQIMVRMSKEEAGRILDGTTEDGVPY